MRFFVVPTVEDLEGQLTKIQATALNFIHGYPKYNDDMTETGKTIKDGSYVKIVDDGRVGSLGPVYSVSIIAPKNYIDKLNEWVETTFVKSKMTILITHHCDTRATQGVDIKTPQEMEFTNKNSVFRLSIIPRNVANWLDEFIDGNSPISLFSGIFISPTPLPGISCGDFAYDIFKDNIWKDIRVVEARPIYAPLCSIGHKSDWCTTKSVIPNVLPLTLEEAKKICPLSDICPLCSVTYLTNGGYYLCTEPVTDSCTVDLPLCTKCAFDTAPKKNFPRAYFKTIYYVEGNSDIINVKKNGINGELLDLYTLIHQRELISEGQYKLDDDTIGITVPYSTKILPKDSTHAVINVGYAVMKQNIIDYILCMKLDVSKKLVILLV
jgi:hypothetical protein